MTTINPASVATLGTLRAEDGVGIVRLEDRFDVGIGDLWAALTEPRHLAHWLGELEGDLRLGGEFRARFFASGWEGTGRVEVCDAPQRLVVRTESEDEPGGRFDATLSAAGEQTILVIEDRGLPLAQIDAYGAGDQIHIEDLAAYLAGRERCDARARWGELQPHYQVLAEDLARSLS